MFHAISHVYYSIESDVQQQHQIFGKLEHVKIVSKHWLKVCILNSNLDFGEQSTWHVLVYFLCNID